MISAAFPYEKQRKQVLGRTMAYVGSAYQNLKTVR
jgi:hypothetical protein